LCVASKLQEWDQYSKFDKETPRLYKVYKNESLLLKKKLETEKNSNAMMKIYRHVL